jgi:nitrile hydratase
MNGIHDCGGMAGLGKIDITPDERPFYAEWERRAFGLFWATGCLGAWNLDEARHSMEKMEAVEYLKTAYYEHWAHAMEHLLVEKGVVTAEELAAKRNDIAKGETQ